MRKPSVPLASELLSREDELALLEDSLLQRLPHRNVLFKPTASFYDQLVTPEGIRHAMQEIYRWLGVKPSKIHVELSDVAILSQKDETTLIPQSLQAQPYQLASTLTLFVISQCLERRLKYPSPQSLTETASIESGLGAIILNGITEKPSVLGWWHHGVQGRHAYLQVLESYSATTYANRFAHFCQASNQDAKTVMAQLSRNAAELIPAYYRHQAKTYRKPPKIIRQSNIRASRTIAKLIAASALAALVCSLGLFIYSQRPFEPNKAEITQYNKVQALSKSYDSCVSDAKKQQNTYKQDDIFQEQTINAALTKCQSIQNEYNYEVATYNELLEKH